MADHRTTADTDELQDIYRALKKGLGHELVNDDNVFALIDLAKQDGNSVVEQELREWQSPCGDGAGG